MALPTPDPWDDLCEVCREWLMPYDNGAWVLLAVTHPTGGDLRDRLRVVRTCTPCNNRASKNGGWYSPPP